MFLVLRNFLVLILIIASYATCTACSNEKPDGNMNTPNGGSPVDAGTSEDGVESSEQVTLTHETTILVSPDDVYATGGFCRINYIPTTDRFAVTFGGITQEESRNRELSQGQEGGNTYYYKEHTLDLEFNGNHGLLHRGGGDSACIVVGDYYYFLTGGYNSPEGTSGWILKKIDPATWTDVTQIGIEVPASSDEGGYYGLGDEMLAFGNGYFDASGLHDSNPSGQGGDGTHHHIFTADLQPVKTFNLHDTDHIDGSSMVFANNAYQLVTANTFMNGQLIVMQYDADFKYLGSKTLLNNSMWPQGLLWDEETQRYFVAYLLHQQGNNVHLAIFDRDWNLELDIAVTAFAPQENTNAGRPWVIRHGDHVYVSYDTDTMNTAGEEDFKWECWVAVYDLNK